MNSEYLINLEKTFGANNYKPLDVVLSHGKGVWVWDVDGKKYLDCLSAYSAVNQGHCHPALTDVIISQAGKLTLSSRAFRNDKLPILLQKICDLTGFAKFLPMNSGSEAVETALKAARKWGMLYKNIEDGRQEIIVCTNNFSGRTISIISFSTEQQYKNGFAPHTPGFTAVAYGDASELEKAITPDTVAFLVEPIQGEGGVIVPPAGYLSDCAEICKKHNILFIADEIQSGLGRSGKLFAYEYDFVRPDIVIVGKALSGGYYPVSGILADEEIMNVFTPGDHGSTFGGNPLGAAVAIESLRILVEEKMIENSYAMGEYFRTLLSGIESSYIKEVRGKGLFIGVELHPEAGGARRFCEALQQNGLLCKETHTHIIRFTPPLVITKAEIDFAFAAIEKVFKTL